MTTEFDKTAVLRRPICRDRTCCLPLVGREAVSLIVLNVRVFKNATGGPFNSALKMLHLSSKYQAWESAIAEDSAIAIAVWGQVKHEAGPHGGMEAGWDKPSRPMAGWRKKPAKFANFALQ